MKKSRAD